MSKEIVNRKTSVPKCHGLGSILYRCSCTKVMYCLQWLIPVLLLPKPLVHPSMLYSHAMFVAVYLLTFFLERRPCYICSFVFFFALTLLCYQDKNACILWPSCKMDSRNSEVCLSPDY
ncbi:Bladder cancer-associated protein A [Trichinella pseudospiralis]|uniref:Bladder cancer-associated protein A n=1 Tax=Trichinella pseudospiralis TaxID=6337 RepID=A0A0V1FXR7_TRIPS|nr:Bladder cancer-associated protein A [Trichinella pseudospiralis]